MQERKLHRIRLKEPWRREWSTGSDGRSEAEHQVLFKRMFNCPTGLSPDQDVFVELCLHAGVELQRAELNGQQLGRDAEGSVWPKRNSSDSDLLEISLSAISLRDGSNQLSVLVALDESIATEGASATHAPPTLAEIGSVNLTICEE